MANTTINIIVIIILLKHRKNFPENISNHAFLFPQVLYFRKLANLRSVQMTGNPCTERSGYTSYLIAFVPQLVYYGYKMITEKERDEANEKHR